VGPADDRNQDTIDIIAYLQAPLGIVTLI
jgi:hypothetical protein